MPQVVRRLGTAPTDLGLGQDSTPGGATTRTTEVGTDGAGQLRDSVCLGQDSYQLLGRHLPQVFILSIPPASFSFPRTSPLHVANQHLTAMSLFLSLLYSCHC